MTAEDSELKDIDMLEIQTVPNQSDEPILSIDSAEVDLAPLESLGPPIRKLEANAARNIAYILVIGFMLLLASSIFYVFRSLSAPASSQALLFNQGIDLLKTVAAVLAGLVGAVVTYYFSLERRKSES